MKLIEREEGLTIVKESRLNGGDYTLFKASLCQPLPLDEAVPLHGITETEILLEINPDEENWRESCSVHR